MSFLPIMFSNWTLAQVQAVIPARVQAIILTSVLMTILAQIR